MKQLLIVNSTRALNAKTPSGTLSDAKDFSALAPGAIAFSELGSNTLMSALATKNFCIALGRPNGQLPFIISEVDIRSLSIVKSVPVAAATFEVSFAVPTPSDVTELIPTTSRVISPINEYGVVFIKKGTVPHERNTWTIQVATQATTAAEVATKLAAAINAKANEIFDFEAEASSGTVTATCKKAGEEWEVKFIDCLEVLNGEPTYTDDGNSEASPAVPATFITGYTIGENVTVTYGRKAIGDKADIQDLASRCAAGKGFTDTYRDGDTIYSAYPETVEDTTYNVYTLRFRVGRDSAKTRDERVWQIVHVAVPVGATAASAIGTILPAGNYMDNVNAG